LGSLLGSVLYPRSLLAPQLWMGILHGPDLCPRILHGAKLSVPWRRPDLGSGILRRQRLAILHWLGLRPYIFRGRPGLELRQQGLG
jgi:hypothetical protein